jgi:uncharacterized membrane protein
MDEAAPQETISAPASLPGDPTAAACPPALRATTRERVIVLGACFGIAALALVLGLVLAPRETRLLLALMAAAFLFLGKFLPLVAIEEPTFGFYELGLVIWAMDTFTVLVLVYSIQALYRWRLPARVLRRVQDKAALALAAFPRLRRYAFFGMVLFVLFPVSGTGAIGGTLLGALLGLHRARIIAACCLGGLIGGLGMALLAERFGRAIEGARDNPWAIVLLVALLLAGVLALNHAYRRALRRNRKA